MATNKRIILKKTDNTILVVIPVDSSKNLDENEEVWLNRLAISAANNAILTGILVSSTDYKIIDISSLPRDRIFRDAWVSVNNEVTIDMTKARFIHKERLLAIRDDKIKEIRNKIEYLEDNGRNNEAVQLRSKRGRLNRIEQGLDEILNGISSPDALESYIPEELRD